MFRQSAVGRATQRARRRRRGIITLLAAVMLVMLFGFVAFVVDTGMIMMSHANVQNIADAASLAAWHEIPAALLNYE